MSRLSGRETRHAGVERSDESTRHPSFGENAERSDHHEENDDLSEHENSFPRVDSGERSELSDSLWQEGNGERSAERSAVPNAAEFFPLLYEDDFDPAEVK